MAIDLYLTKLTRPHAKKRFFLAPTDALSKNNSVQAGPPAGHKATLTAGTNGAKTVRPMANLWLNVGYEIEADTADGKVKTFIGLPFGLPLDTMEPVPTNSSSKVFANIQAARNHLLRQLIEAGALLKPGEEKVINLQVKLRRVSEPCAIVSNPDACIQPTDADDSSFCFPFFYHMTHKNNLAGILQHGILSHTDVLARNDVLATDISDAEVQKWRNRKESVNHRAIHDYAPLYINPKNPMLCKRRNLQHEIVILKISPGVLQDGEHVFSDGNAASHETKFASNSNIVADSMAAINAEYWTDCADGKRRRCAELLVYPKVQPVHILSIICNNNALAEEIAMGTNLQIEVNPSMFF